jgi:hypothetical protein
MPLKLDLFSLVTFDAVILYFSAHKALFCSRKKMAYKRNKINLKIALPNLSKIIHHKIAMVCQRCAFGKKGKQLKVLAAHVHLKRTYIFK